VNKRLNGRGEGEFIGAENDPETMKEKERKKNEETT
jgi:hypothetical protein